MFILGQIISNSVKYVGNNLAPRLIFSIADSMNSEQISLSIKDNGTSIPLSDLPLFSTRGLPEIRAVTLVVLQVWAYTLFRKWQLTYLSRWSLKTIHTVEQP